MDAILDEYLIKDVMGIVRSYWSPEREVNDIMVKKYNKLYKYCKDSSMSYMYKTIYISNNERIECYSNVLDFIRIFTKKHIEDIEVHNGCIALVKHSSEDKRKLMKVVSCKKCRIILKLTVDRDRLIYKSKNKRKNRDRCKYCIFKNRL